MQMRKSMGIFRIFLIVTLVGTFSPMAANADIYSDPFSVAQYSGFIPSGDYIYVNGSNLLGVTSVKVGTQDATEISKGNGYLYFFPGLLAPGSYEFTLSNNSATSITKTFEVFNPPTFGVATPTTGDKKGGTVVRIPGLNFCSDTIKEVSITVTWGIQNLPLISSCSEIEFAVPSVKQAQQVTFQVRVNVTSKAGLTAPKYGSTYSYVSNVNFLYTSGNSATNTAFPSISASLSSGSSPGICILTIKGSGLNSGTFYEGRASAFNGLSIVGYAWAGYSYSDKRGVLTLTSGALPNNIWAASSGNTIIASFYDSATSKSYSSVAKNQC